MDSHTVESNEDDFIKNRKSKEKPPLWDSFQDPPSRRATGSAANWAKLGCLLKLFKLLTYMLVFIVILGTAIISKLSFVLMVAHIRPNANVKICNILDKDGLFTANMPKEEQYTWIWALIFAFSAPEVLTFFRSLRICIFKDVKSPTWLEFMLVLFFEILHTIGMAIFVFFVMPQLDSVRTLMLCNGVCFIPSILSIRLDIHLDWHSIISLIMSILAILAQVSAFTVWPTFSSTLAVQMMALPLIFVSVRWWENYTSSYPCLAHIMNTFRRSRSRYQTYIYLSPLKIVVFSLIGFCFHGQRIIDYFSTFMNAWKSHEILVQPGEHLDDSISLQRNVTHPSRTFTISTNASTAIYVLLLQVCSSYLCYICAKFACKIKIQEFSFSLPVSLAGPTSIAIALWISWTRGANVCAFHAFFPDYLSLIGNVHHEFTGSIVANNLWIWPLWWLSQLWVTRHIWRPRNDKNAPTEKLFICPWYCGFLVDQCIAMNRRIIDFNEESLSRKVTLLLG